MSANHIALDPKKSSQVNLHRLFLGIAFYSGHKKIRKKPSPWIGKVSALVLAVLVYSYVFPFITSLSIELTGCLVKTLKRRFISINCFFILLRSTYTIHANKTMMIYEIIITGSSRKPTFYAQYNQKNTHLFFAGLYEWMRTCEFVSNIHKNHVFNK